MRIRKKNLNDAYAGIKQNTMVSACFSVIIVINNTVITHITKKNYTRSIVYNDDLIKYKSLCKRKKNRIIIFHHTLSNYINLLKSRFYLTSTMKKLINREFHKNYTNNRLQCVFILYTIYTISIMDFR